MNMGPAEIVDVSRDYTLLGICCFVCFRYLTMIGCWLGEEGRVSVVCY